MKKKKGFPAEVACGEGLAGEICRHNKKKLNKSDEEMEKSSKAERMKNLVRKLKREKKKILGQVSITGVTKPEKRAKGKVKEHKEEKHEGASKPKRAKKQVLVGKHGGQYIITSGGKKKYETAKKSLEDFIESDNKVQQFLTNYRSKKNG